MSEAEENKALVRRLFEELAKGDSDVIDELAATDFVDHALMPGQGPTRENLKRSVAGFHAAFSITGFTIVSRSQKATRSSPLARREASCGASSSASSVPVGGKLPKSSLSRQEKGD